MNSLAVDFQQNFHTSLPDPVGMQIRRKHFGDEIIFHAPGLKHYSTSEYQYHNRGEFVSISVTGSACALSCEHCKSGVLHGMTDLGSSDGTLYDLCARLHDRGAKGVLISGGSDKRGRVPLKKHIPDLIKVRSKLDMLIRVHPGLPDEATCAGLADVGIDGAMVDIIGHNDTIREVYHLNTNVGEYEVVLERLERYGVPCVPHIVMGLHFGRMLGEQQALEMISRYPLKLLVLVILMPLTGTPMASVQPPTMDEIEDFFLKSRQTIQNKPVMLGCARPLGRAKVSIDRLAIDAGLNGVAFPAEGIVAYAKDRGLKPQFINACCGVSY